MATVTVGGRLHFGFLNLSLAHERLYGGMGVALEAPVASVTAARAETVVADDPVASHAARAVETLDVPGATVTVDGTLPRHVGLGSGTQHALATYGAVAAAYGRDPDVRAAAPALGRGGRSGVGVAAFEAGGFVLDGGHPTARFTTERPPDGEWEVPAVTARHDLPADWRVVLVLPDAEPGRSGDDEDDSMRTAVERADPTIADDVAATVTRRLLPAAASGDLGAFGDAVAAVGRRNGAWYADEQGGVYRPPVGSVVAALSDAAAIEGAGQSSWGPTVYGFTDAERAAAARDAGERALAAAGVDGRVLVTGVRNRGASVERDA